MDEKFEYTIACAQSPEDYIQLVDTSRLWAGHENLLDGSVLIRCQYNYPNCAKEEEEQSTSVLLNEDKVDELITALLFWKQHHESTGN